MLTNSFSALGIAQEVVEVIEEKGYEQPTSIQNKTIPRILAGDSIAATSATGSGKTLCYCSPIITNVIPGKGVQALIIVPTKSLAIQVEKEIQVFAKHTSLTILGTHGGSSYKDSLNTAHKADIIIGTTGRISDLAEQGAFELGRVKFCVFDEMDEMLQSQYFGEVEFILKMIPKKSQKLIFSATISKDANKLLKHYCKSLKRITAQTHVSPKKIQQEVYFIPAKEKLSLLIHILSTRSFGLVMIFANRQDVIEWLSKNLEKLTSFEVRELHGATSSGKRKKVIKEFEEEKFDILVTSDLAARGLDIHGISHIINYSIPKDPDKYIHRIGRTARAGEHGTSISFVTPNEEEAFLEIVKSHSISPILKEVPEYEVIEPVKSYNEKKPRR